MTKTMLEKEIANARRIERPARLRDIDSAVKKALEKAMEDVDKGVRKTARAEAETLYRRMREDEEYERLRAGRIAPDNSRS